MILKITLLVIKTEFLNSNSSYNYIIFLKSSINSPVFTTSKLIFELNIRLG